VAATHICNTHKITSVTKAHFLLLLLYLASSCACADLGLDLDFEVQVGSDLDLDLDFEVLGLWVWTWTSCTSLAAVLRVVCGVWWLVAIVALKLSLSFEL
jgi:hypothetical protein